jgi:hypothetical protein
MIALFDCFCTSMMDVWMISRCSYSFYSSSYAFVRELTAYTSNKIFFRTFLWYSSYFFLWIYNSLPQSISQSSHIVSTWSLQLFCIQVFEQFNILLPQTVLENTNFMPASCWMFSWLTLWPWRWRQCIPLIWQWTSTGLHEIPSQKIILFTHHCENITSK